MIESCVHASQITFDVHGVVCCKQSPVPPAGWLIRVGKWNYQFYSVPDARSQASAGGLA